MEKRKNPLRKSELISSDLRDNKIMINNSNDQ